MNDKQLRAKQDRELEKQKFVADIKNKAEISRRFMADERHAEFKELIETAITYKRGIYESLIESKETNENLLKQMLILLTEIKTLRWILNTPEKFIQAEVKILNEEGNNENI